MSETTRGHNPADDEREPDTGQLDQMRAAVADEVARLLSRLPKDAGVLEITMAEGSDPTALARYLANLPDTDELTTLTAALNDPDALTRLLAARDTTSDPPDDAE